MNDQISLHIICLNTYLTQYHYQSYSILKEYLLKSIRCGIKKQSLKTNNNYSDSQRALSPTIVVFPECIGSWLYLMCVPMPKCLRNYFFNDNSMKINRHKFFIFYTLITHIRLYLKEIYKNYHFKTTWLGLIKRSWFTLFSVQTNQLYKNLFSELSYETNTIIVAGSTFNYDHVSNERQFHNLSYVFEPEHAGDSICLKSGKQYPVDEEQSFIDSYKHIPMIYSIPNTNIDIAVLICADSWMPDIYEKYNEILLNSKRRFLFIIVALNAGQWNIKWPGYDIHVNVPNDVDKEHLSTYTLKQAWYKYSVSRAYNVLDKYKGLTGYGVVCCQSMLNIMNDIQGQGESMIVIKRSLNENKIVFESNTDDNENILTCEF